MPPCAGVRCHRGSIERVRAAIWVRALLYIPAGSRALPGGLHAAAPMLHFSQTQTPPDPVCNLRLVKIGSTSLLSSQPHRWISSTHRCATCYREDGHTTKTSLLPRACESTQIHCRSQQLGGAYLQLFPEPRLPCHRGQHGARAKVGQQAPASAACVCCACAGVHGRRPACGDAGCRGAGTCAGCGCWGLGAHRCGLQAAEALSLHAPAQHATAAALQGVTGCVLSTTVPSCAAKTQSQCHDLVLMIVWRQLSCSGRHKEHLRRSTCIIQAGQQQTQPWAAHAEHLEQCAP